MTKEEGGRERGGGRRDWLVLVLVLELVMVMVLSSERVWKGLCVCLCCLFSIKCWLFCAWGPTSANRTYTARKNLLTCQFRSQDMGWGLTMVEWVVLLVH